MRIPANLRVLAFVLMGFIGANVAHATFHLMQIEQVIGGVNGDASAQAIQLRMRSAGENLVSSASIWVADAAGTNRILILNIPSNVANSAAGDRVLIVSTNFAQYTSPTVVPDFTMAQLIPTNYLKAGRLTYEADGGTTTTPGTIYWSLSWGGTNYTGAQTGITFNDADGNFGPAFSGPLPSSSTNALRFTNSASALSTSNVVDYVLTSGPVTFVNNARNSFLVFVLQPPTLTLSQETNDILITWTTTSGKTNFLQRTTGTLTTGLTTNFTDIFTVTNNLGSVTNYLDVGAVTNFQSGFYRVRLAP